MMCFAFAPQRKNHAILAHRLAYAQVASLIATANGENQGVSKNVVIREDAKADTNYTNPRISCKRGHGVSI